MLGSLPTSLNAGEKTLKINADFRNIFQIISAFNDDSLSDGEKVYILFRRLYIDFWLIEPDDYESAYKAAMDFINCNSSSSKSGPKVVDWEKDEQLIFAAVNRVAGCEVRSCEFVHWWTFLGWYQSIDQDCLFSYIVSIRQKKAKGKKLEKSETEFYNNNRELFISNAEISKRKNTEKFLEDLFNELSGGEDDG